MFLLDRRARGTVEPRAPNSWATRQEYPAAQPSLLGRSRPGFLGQDTWRSERRGLRQDLRAERRAVKAELKAYRHELRGEPRLGRREKRAMKYAAEAALWGDVIGRREERVMQSQSPGPSSWERDVGLGRGYGAPRREEGAAPRQSQRDAGFEPGYRTLRERDAEREFVDPPPRYEDVVGMKDSRVYGRAEARR